MSPYYLPRLALLFEGSLDLLVICRLSSKNKVVVVVVVKPITWKIYQGKNLWG